jgi:hypothetical protein
MIPKGCTPRNGVKVFAIMEATSEDAKVISDSMPVRVRDWISSAFCRAGSTALTFLTAARINPPDAAWAERKPHRGLPLTGAARRAGWHVSSSGDYRPARPGSLLDQGGKRSTRIAYLAWSAHSG